MITLSTLKSAIFTLNGKFDSLLEKYIKVFDYLMRKLVRREGLFEKHD